MSRQVFLKGALALSISALISKLLGLFYVIPLKHFAGDEGLALYQAVFPIYNTILMLSVSGIPIALAKLISEKLASQQSEEIPFIVKSAFRFMIGVSFFGVLFFYAGANQIAAWIGSQNTKLSIQAMAFAILIVPFVAVLRGYFYGFQRMNLSASSQIIEQFIRVGSMTFIVYWLVMEGKDISVVSAGAAWGSFIGLAVSLFLLVGAYFRYRTKEGPQRKRTGEGGYAWKIMAIAIPASLSTLMIPLLGMVDSMSIINLLKAAGLSEGRATIEFGVYSRGVPIVQFSSFYATGLALAAVPALSSVKSLRERREHIYKALQLTVLAGIPASIGMMMIAQPLNVLFYGNGQGSTTLVILAASTFFLSLSVTMSGVLQGIGKQIWPAVFLFVGLVTKVVGNFWLVPHYGIEGAAYSTLVSYGIISILCIGFIYQEWTGFQREFFKWLLPSGLMLISLWGALYLTPEWFKVTQDRLHALAVVLLLVIIGMFSYAVGLILFRTIRLKDILQMKKRQVGMSEKSGVSIPQEYDIQHIREKKEGTKHE